MFNAQKIIRYYIIFIINNYILSIIFIFNIVLFVIFNGKLIYISKRDGKKLEEFKIYKFRSMIKNAENFGPEVSGLNDKGVVIIMDDYRTCIEASNAVKDFEMKINTKFKLKNYSKGCVYFFKT